jgi:tyrosyl-tRNA synthetase
MNVFDELSARGMIAQATDEVSIRELLSSKKPPLPSTSGLTRRRTVSMSATLSSIMVMAHKQRAGHRPIALLGGGTAMVGDPTGKTDMRKMMTTETIAHNVDCFKRQMSRFMDFSEGKAFMVNNADWLLSINLCRFPA